jgi:asparagine synthase (glutamine-hydrolysing)
LSEPRFVGVVSIDGHPLGALLTHFKTHFTARLGRPPQVLVDPAPEPLFAMVLARDVKVPTLAALQDESGSIVVMDGDRFDGATRSTDQSLRRALEIFEQEGAQGCNRLLSQASFIHWSAAKRRLMACRHQIGFAPIYFSLFRGKLVFSSDQSTLLSLPIDRTPDLAAVDFLLSNGYALAPLSFIKGIRKLPAGNALYGEAGRRAWHDRYYELPVAIDRHVGPEERRATAKRLLVAAIERRKGNGSPAVLLSAGVDSALILAILSRELGAPCEAFTFRYLNYEGQFNEHPLAKGIADHFGAKHHLIDCGPDDIASNLTEMIANYGEPFTYGLHSFKLAPIRDAGLTRCFSGGGADCLNIDDSGLASIWYKRLPRWMRMSAEGTIALTSTVMPALARRAYPFFWGDRTGLPTAVYPAIMHDEQRRLLYADRTRFDLGLAELRGILHRKVDRFRDQPPADLWRYVDMQTFCAESMNLWISMWARSNHVSVLDPYFDLELMDYMMRVSPNGYGKRQFRELAATMMPSTDAYRPKIPQTIPIGDWLRGPLQFLLRDYLTEQKLGDIFDMSQVTRLVDRHVSGQQDLMWTLWGLISFSAWRTDWLARQTVTAPDSIAGYVADDSNISIADVAEMTA